MKVQKTISPQGQQSFIVIGDDYKPIPEISVYLRFLEVLERSPYTIRTRATHLKAYWSFLMHRGFEWRDITLEELAEFIHWLKLPDPKVSPILDGDAYRSARTINVMLGSVYAFYEFHQHNSGIAGIDAFTKRVLRHPSYKPLLHGIKARTRTVTTPILRIKEPKTFPGCLSRAQVKRLIDACASIRDKFLLSVLYESGIRLGEALGLRHEDLESAGKNEIHICPRPNNLNGARAKNHQARTVHVSRALMQLYSTYLIEEYPAALDSDYVFVNISREPRGAPMKSSNVQRLFRQLRQKTGIAVTPHLFRHTHATELIQSNWDLSYVQKRLGHRNIQTTANTYVHLSDEDLKQAHQDFIERQKHETYSDTD